MRVCSDNELVIAAWSPIHLRAKMKELYWKGDKTSAGAMAFWEDTLRYLYLPRLKDREVLAQAIRNGAASKDFFGTAYGMSGTSFDGFQFGTGTIQLDDTLLLIEPEAARSEEENRQALESKSSPAGASNGAEPAHARTSSPSQSQVEPGSKPRLFHGTAEIAPATAKMRLVEIADEIIRPLITDPNAKVRITVEIAAEFPDGAADHVKRAVSENARSLALKTADWE